MSANTKLPPINKIAVLHADALRDFIFTLPALRALRQSYPRAEIVLLALDWHASFAAGHVSYIDRIIALPPYPGIGKPKNFHANKRSTQKFFDEMRQEQFDLALQMHDDGEYSNDFVNQLGAKYTIGSRAAFAAGLDKEVPYVFYQNEILRCLEIARLAKATTNNIVPRIKVTAQDKTESRHLTSASRRYIVMHPGASDPRRRWPAEKFARTASYFISKGFRVYVTGIDDEKDIAATIERLTGKQAKSLCGKLSLNGLAGLLDNAKLMISNDSGPLHLARAIGCPTVGIYWCRNFLVAGPIQTANDQSLLSWTLSCPVCHAACVDDTLFGRQTCKHQVSFVKSVRIADVLRAASIAMRQD